MQGLKQETNYWIIPLQRTLNKFFSRFVIKNCKPFGNCNNSIAPDDLIKTIRDEH